MVWYRNYCRRFFSKIFYVREGLRPLSFFAILPGRLLAQHPDFRNNYSSYQKFSTLSSIFFIFIFPVSPTVSCGQFRLTPSPFSFLLMRPRPDRRHRRPIFDPNLPNFPPNQSPDLFSPIRRSEMLKVGLPKRTIGRDLTDQPIG